VRPWQRNLCSGSTLPAPRCGAYIVASWFATVFQVMAQSKNHQPTLQNGQIRRKAIPSSHGATARRPSRNRRPGGGGPRFGQRHQRKPLATLTSSPARAVWANLDARILAKALNCVQGPTDEPCGTCDICREYHRGQSVDVIEMMESAIATSMHRDIRSNAQYRPSRGALQDLHH